MTERDFLPIGERCYSSTLPNGLSVYTVPRPDCLITHVLVGVQYGSMDTDFMVGSRSRHTPRGSAACLCELLGNRCNVVDTCVTSTMSCYYQAIEGPPYDQIRDILRKLLDAETDDAELTIAKQQLQAQQILASFGRKAVVCAISNDKLMLSSSGYPDERTAEKITRELLHICHSAFYQPSNMVLCVIGDVRPLEVERAAASASIVQKTPLVVRDYSAYRFNIDSAHEYTSAGNLAETSFTALYYAECADSLKKQLISELACEILFGQGSDLRDALKENASLYDDLDIERRYTPEHTIILITGAASNPAVFSEAVLNKSIRIAWNGLDDLCFEQAVQRVRNRKVSLLDDCKDTCLHLAQSHYLNACYFEFAEVLQRIEKYEAENYIRDTFKGENSILFAVYPKGALL